MLVIFTNTFLRKSHNTDQKSHILLHIVWNVNSNITDHDLTTGSFKIECTDGQGAKSEYNTWVPRFKCDKCERIICDQCIKDGAHRGHHKYLKPYNNGWIL